LWAGGSFANSLHIRKASKCFSNHFTKAYVKGKKHFAKLISHQPAVLFSQNKPATSNQPAVFFSQNKPAPAISHQPNEQADG
jgi:hypothetical protein